MTTDDEIELQAAEIEQLLPGLARRLFAVDPDHPLADLPVAQLRVCGLLFQRGARTMSQVGEELSISLSAVTQLADRLERAGLVARTAESAPAATGAPSDYA
jgi:DNA-binding MarR family transcriptional regulator